MQNNKYEIWSNEQTAIKLFFFLSSGDDQILSLSLFLAAEYNWKKYKAEKALSAEVIHH